MSEFRFGIVGTGVIANAIADAIEAADAARTVAVSGRTPDDADAFASSRTGVEAAKSLAALLSLGIDAVYVAVPTSLKENIVTAAIQAGKHVLVEKPFMDQDSVRRMADAATAAGLVFMDATHFVHHPRRAAVQAAIPERVGQPLVMHAAFYIVQNDRNNIRYDPTLEPTGALGDIGWYCMRAIVEYLRPEGALATVEAACRRDPATGTVTQVTGVMSFESGELVTFGAGFEIGTELNELSLIGEKGVLQMDDFAFNWADSILAQDREVPIGYTWRAGAMTRRGFAFVETPSDKNQQTLMIEAFIALATGNDREQRRAYISATKATQSYLDAMWARIQEA